MLPENDSCLKKSKVGENTQKYKKILKSIRELKKLFCEEGGFGCKGIKGYKFVDTTVN